MNVFIYSTAKDFLTATGDLLQSDKARYGLVYGIARQVAVNSHHYGEEDPWFCTVGDSDGVNVLAWRIPPYSVGLAWYTGDPEEAVSLLIEAVRRCWQEITGIIGHREVTDPFAKRWSEIFGTSIQSMMAQRIYRLDSINNLPSVSGRMRLATLADRDLVSAWTHAFRVEAAGPTNEIIPEHDITPAIKKGECYLWDVGRQVSMAMKSRPTTRGMTVNYVYTPPELRRKGYATACVAGVCSEILNMQNLLDIGRKYVSEGTPEKISDEVYKMLIPELEKLRLAWRTDLYEYATKLHISSQAVGFTKFCEKRFAIVGK